MAIFNQLLPQDTFSARTDQTAASTDEALELLFRGFGVEFDVFDWMSGEIVHTAVNQPACDWYRWAEMYREVTRRGRAEFVAEESPLLVMAVPLLDIQDAHRVAVATFLTRPLTPEDDLFRSATQLGMPAEQAARWVDHQTPCPPQALERIAELVLRDLGRGHRIRRLEAESRNLSIQMSATYEEISLLHRLTQNLKLSEDEEELGEIALEWLEEVVLADGLAIQYLPVNGRDGTFTQQARTESELLASGNCPVSNEQFTALMQHLGLVPTSQPTVVNRMVTEQEDWPFPDVRQMVAVPLVEGDNLFGWLAAFNHTDDDEFGTGEASLLGSVGAILGIHGGNLELYRQQAELLAGIVRALTSSIDAKDPYTCGHSERVAQVAVRLAKEVGFDQEALNRMYLAGLLHDIGKIGINDSVLRKPDKLTDEEYEHIKTHVTIGNKILRDLRKLDDIVPVVLYHHESWDGSGYPRGLAEKDIPLAARIVSVADSIDAMGSDRPYRKGLPDEKIDTILASGAGQQWDPEITDAFFRARDDIRQIIRAAQKPK